MNDRIYIEGGHQLKGSIRIQGSKNAALPMMAASLLHRGVSVLKGCPRIADVFWMEEILQKLGAVTWWEDHDLYMDCENAGKWSVPFEYTGRMRSSVILLGALLARNGKGSLGYPGGCVIGKRPIDMHLFVLRKLGAVITEEQGFLMAEAPHLQGVFISGIGRLMIELGIGFFFKKKCGSYPAGHFRSRACRGRDCTGKLCL